jgi:Asp/Glu/hydantoin racemase
VTIHIINPNSSMSVTHGIDRAVDGLRASSMVPIQCHSLEGAPKGIESQAHIESVVLPLLEKARDLDRQDEASAFIVACFSDPGLALLREQIAKPVLGIAESAVLTAMTLGQRFGIVSILSASVSRHMRYLGAMGVMDRLAADLPLELTVAQLSEEKTTMARLSHVARQLREARGADVIILGCAGMAPYRRALEQEIGIPVVDPCQAAAAMAIGRVAYSRMNALDGEI